MKSIATLLIVGVFCLPAALIGQTFSDMSSNLPGTFYSGGCVGVCDMNQDGYDDIVVLDESTTIRVLYQQPSGAFSATEFGAVSGSNQWGMAVADIDNDGHGDVFSGGAYDGTHVLMCHEDGTSELLALEEGSLFMQGANLADINNDGWLDAFGCHDDAESRIWTNDGTGALTPENSMIDMATTPVSDNSGNYGSVWTDFDRDGDIDLYIAKCRQGVTDPMDMRRINALFENDGSGNFTNSTDSRGMVVYEQSWTSDFADIDNDGDFDLYLTNHSNTAMILENDGAGNFTDITEGSGIEVGGFYLQAKMADFDNDGFVDLVYSGGLHAYYKGNGDGTFTELPGTFPGDDTMHSLSVGDLNKDGHLDLYASYGNGYVNPDYGNPDRLWMNDGNDNNWIAFDLNGVMSNINAIGALVQIQGDFGVQIREVRSGESYGITNSHTMHFGLGANESVDSVVIFWPSGETTVIEDPSINTYHEIDETDCDLDDIAIFAIGDLTICPGETVDLTASMGYSYVWSNGQTSQTITVGEIGNYTVVAYDADGCSAASATVTVTVLTPEVPTITVIGETEFCEGENIVLSASDAASYDWSSGQDTQDIVVTESGDYTVQITGECNEPISSEPVIVTVYEAAPTPVIDDILLDTPGEGTFIGTSENLFWYDSEDATDALYQGAEYTATFNETTSIWVEDATVIGGGEAQGGLEENTANGQYHFNSNYYLTFDAVADIVIESVKVYAGDAGEREIGVIDGSGTLVAQGTFMLEEGEQVVELNFEVPAGENYGLRCLDDDPQLWRDQSDDDLPFPYDLNGLASITGTSVTSNNWNNYWYFFYDWSIYSPAIICPSERIEVIATVLSVEDLAGTTSLEMYPNPANDQATLSISSLVNGELDITLRDAAGRAVRTEQRNVITGTQQLELDLSNIATGVYTVTFELNGARATRQLAVR